jgi:hypothetical protein
MLCEANMFACMHVLLFFLRMYICICVCALTFMQSIVESVVNRKHALRSEYVCMHACVVVFFAYVYMHMCVCSYIHAIHR